MLSQLAGPIPILARNGEAFWTHEVAWCEALSCLVAISHYDVGGVRSSARSWALYTIQLDGKATALSERQNWSGLGYFDDGDYVVGSPYFRRTLLPSTHVSGPEYLTPTGPSDQYRQWGVASRVQLGGHTGVIFSVGSAGIYRRALDVGGGYPYEVACAFPQAQIGAGYVLPYKATATQQLWFACSPTGVLWQYDAVANTIVAGSKTSIGVWTVGCAYSKAHDLLFKVVRGATAADPDQLYVYANEPQASTLTPPAFATTPPRRGQRVKVTTRVLGDQGEPCGGRVVQFSAVAAQIESAAVETDATGTATATFRADAPGPATVTATLVE